MAVRRGGAALRAAAALALLGAAHAGVKLSSLSADLSVSVAGASTCSVDDYDACADPLTPGTDSITVSWSGTTTATKAKVMICYSGSSKKDRKWRKTKDDVSKDKQCEKLNDAVDFSDGSLTKQLPTEQAKGLYFVRVYAVEDGSEVTYGQTAEYLKVKRYDSLSSSGIPEAAIICSILGVSTLFVYFGVDKMMSKKEPGEVKAEQTFVLPVDSEHKATEIRLSTVAQPHMRAFHFTWVMFFTAFFSTFAPAALGPVLRQDLDLTKSDLGEAGSAAVTGTIFCRLVMGTFCDTFGPRYGFAFVMVLTAPAVFLMSVATDAVGYICCRFFIGFSLATFVSCQFWCSVMFNGKLVGLANATAAGWGNLGGGVTQFLIPAIFMAIAASMPDYEAWRWTFFVPGAAHVVLGIGCLFFAQDMPDGQYAFLKKEGQMENVSAAQVVWLGVTNYRMWILTFTYGFCFGVELTMNNIVVNYFHDQFDMDIVQAGICGSLFGMMNIFARSVGGQASDWASGRFGMRGRLWVLWILQTVNGVMCIVMGRLHETLAGTLIAMIVFSFFVQAAEGATFGVVPFVSRRALGVVSGFVGAGGNAGAAWMMNAFFKGENGWSDYETYDAISYMGLVIIVVTLLVFFIDFPMWGSMLFPASSETATEEEYYLSDFSEEERVAGLGKAAECFAVNTRVERGPDRFAALSSTTPQA